MSLLFPRATWVRKRGRTGCKTLSTSVSATTRRTPSLTTLKLWVPLHSRRPPPHRTTIFIYFLEPRKSASPFPTSLEIRRRPPSFLRLNPDVINRLPAVRRLPSFSCGLIVYFPVDGSFLNAVTIPPPANRGLTLYPHDSMNMYAVAASIATMCHWCCATVFRARRSRCLQSLLFLCLYFGRCPVLSVSLPVK